MLFILVLILVALSPSISSSLHLPYPPHHAPSSLTDFLPSDNHLQLPSITHHILDRLLLAPQVTGNQCPLAGPSGTANIRIRHLIDPGKPYPAVLHAPAILARKVHDGALGVEEEEVLR
jgi:hypothetical protein